MWLNRALENRSPNICFPTHKLKSVNGPTFIGLVGHELRQVWISLFDRGVSPKELGGLTQRTGGFDPRSFRSVCRYTLQHKAILKPSLRSNRI